MKNLFSNTFFAVQEGPELSGKSSAVTRLHQVIERALPTLMKEAGAPIHLRKVREPGGSPKGDRGRAMIMNILGLEAQAHAQLSDPAKAEFFTWARWALFQDLIPEIPSGEGMNIYLADRSYLSMMALQGSWAGEAGGVALEELEEAAQWATQGLVPDVAILRKFPFASLQEDISFRQLMILLTGREVMPQDLKPYQEFAKVQRHFDGLAQRYHDDVAFFELNAATDPFLSTQTELEILAESLSRKFPNLSEQKLRWIFAHSLENLIREGKFSETQLMTENQHRLQALLQDKNSPAEEIMNAYRLENLTPFEEIRRTYEAKVAEPEIVLPLRARR